MMEKVKLSFLFFLRRLGIIVKKNSPKNSESLMLNFLIKKLGINTVIDVGANKGQFAESLIKAGIQTKIISFEPLKDAFEVLRLKAKNYSQWTTFNNAIGSKAYETTINVSQNSHSSSLLKVNSNHLEAEEKAQIVSEQTVEVKTLEEMISISSNDKLLLKIDTQGFEYEVLKGSEKLFDSVKVIVVELSMIPLYDESEKFSTIIKFLEEKGYTLYQFFPEFVNPSSYQLLQANGIFVKD